MAASEIIYKEFSNLVRFHKSLLSSEALEILIEG